MGFGRKPPRGHLIAASVDTEQEAKQLISRCCEPVTYGPQRKPGFLAQELEREQTLDNLYAFGARLEAEYQKMLAEKEGK